MTNTYDLDLTRDSDSGAFPVGKNAVVADVDFGYAFAASAVDLAKEGVLEGDAAVGSLVRWTFTLTNTGETDLTDVTLVDHLPGVGEPVITWPGAVGELAVGEQATAEATYALTAQDVARGFVRNTATDTGTDPGGHPVSADADATVRYEVPAETPVPAGPTPAPAGPGPAPSTSPGVLSEVLAAPDDDSGSGGVLARTGTEARGAALLAAALLLLGVGTAGLAARRRRRG